MRLRALDATRDRPALERLWRDALAPAWPPLPDALDRLREGFVAEARGGVAGAVALESPAGVQLLLVAPDHRRRGVGTALLEAAADRLRAAGAERLQLGVGGATAYVWPGVPADLPGAVAFFEARGWRWSHRVTDLTCDVRSYEAAAAPSAGVTLAVAEPADVEAALAFERRWFPSWLPSFERPGSSILLARDGAGAVAGTLLFAGPGRCSIFWPLLGEDMAWIGCVGVAEPARGAGIAGALVTHASALMRDAGAGTCLIDWARRTELYERCGYRRWRDYLMGTG
ncbi:MAG TPA: GNAT family N-acetyltransferase [Candidatus Dormibacteraeota bacterium]|nr:GNAT family N-acetyltransferase [Candidatus Dormibacteraeota bacterium]